MTCPACGVAVPDEANACPACGAYLRLQQVEDLMRRALAAEQGNYYREAAICWGRMLHILPPGSGQRGRIQRRMVQLERLAAQPVTTRRPDAPAVAPPAVVAPAAPRKASDPQARRRLLLPLLLAVGVALVLMLLAAGWRYGPHLLVRFMTREETAAPDPRAAVLAALVAGDWVKADEVIQAGRNEPWVAEARLAGRVLRAPEELREKFRGEPAPDELNRVLALRKQPVWEPLWPAIDTMAAQAIAERLTILQQRKESVPVALTPEAEALVAGVWHEMTKAQEYFNAVDGEKCLPAVAALRQVTVWREEVAPTIVHLWLGNLPPPTPAGGWTAAVATAALARIESALAAREPAGWLAADRERSVAVLRAMAVALGDSSSALPAASRAGYADAVDSPARAGAGTVVDWAGTMLNCEPAAGGQPFSYNFGGSAVTGDYRLHVQIAGGDSGATRMAVALFTGALPAEVTRAAGVRLIARLAGVIPLTNAQGVVVNVPLLNLQRLVLADGTVFAAGVSGPLAPGARARQLLLRLAPPAAGSIPG